MEGFILWNLSLKIHNNSCVSTRYNHFNHFPYFIILILLLGELKTKASRKEWICSALIVVLTFVSAVLVLHLLEKPFFENFGNIIQIIVSILAVCWFVMNFKTFHNFMIKDI